MPSKRKRKLERLAAVNVAISRHHEVYAVLLCMQPTNVDWRAMHNQSRVLYDERDRILEWFKRKGYFTRGL